MGNHSNPFDALNSAGVDNSFLQKIKGGLDNPRYNFLLGLLGMKKEDAKSAIDNLSSGVSYPSAPTEVDSDVEKYSRYL